jgi:phosphoribosylaminoimidazole-succinocarboxamide synthase
MREQVIKLVEIIPIEFIVRNVATGSITKRLGIEDGTVLKEPLIEYCLKDDKLGDPLIAEEHILAFDWATKKEIEKVKKMILRINDFMIGMFRGVGIKLIDFKLEFGRLKITVKMKLFLLMKLALILADFGTVLQIKN